MTGRHKFSELMAKMPPKRRARVDRLAKELREEMDPTQLRTARQLSQAALGEILHVEQPAVVKIEKRTDMYVSTLRGRMRQRRSARDQACRFFPLYGPNNAVWGGA